MDAIFALIFVVYILSAVVQAILGKNVRKRQRGAGAPWPGTYPPRRTPDEGTHVPDGLPFPFPFPFEDVFKEEEEEEEESSLDDLEYEDMTAQPEDYHEKEKVSPWEDKSWGSLGPSLEGQSFGELERDDFYDLHIDDDFADDFDGMALMDDDIAEFMALAKTQTFDREEFTSRSAIIQGIIMSEVLKRPKAFSRHPIGRQ